jgi:subtilase family serine protease
MPKDLIGKSFEINPLLIKPGQKLDLSFAVANNGDEKASPFSVDLYISQDADISSTDDIRLGSYDIRTDLAPQSDTGVKKFSYSTPSSSDPFWANGDGTYYVGMIVDPKNQVLESDEDNNSNQGIGLDSDGVEIASFLPSDLIGTYLDLAQSQIAPGQKLDLSFTVINNNRERANPFSVDLYISPDPEISTSDDIKIGSYGIKEALAGGEDTGIKRFSYYTPKSDNPLWDNGNGTYYIGMVVDSKNEVEETNEDNNSNQGLDLDSDGVEVTRFSPSDLKGSFFDVAQSKIKPGQALDLSFTVANAGNEDANPFSIGLYLAQESDLSGNNYVELGQYDIRNVLEGGKDTGVKRFTYKTPGADDPFWDNGNGEYYVAMVVDSKQEVFETNEDNNSNQGVGLDLDELETSSFSPSDLKGSLFQATPSEAKPGEKVKLSFTVTNDSNQEVNPFSVGLYVSQDANISSEDDIKLGTYDIRTGLTPQANTGVKSFDYSIPDLIDDFWTQGDGTYYFGMVIDSKNEVEETNEDNNSNQGLDLDSDTVNIVDSGIADLAGKQLYMPEELKAGEKFDFGFVVENLGNANSGEFDVGIYLSTNSYISELDDYELGTYSVKNDLAPGEDTGILSLPYTLPDADSDFWEKGNGTYYVGIVVDPEDRVPERNKANNSNQDLFVDFNPVDISGVKADLTGKSFNVVPETIKPGDAFEVEYNVENLKAGQAKDFGVGFYLFSEEHLDEELSGESNDGKLTLDDVPDAYFLFGDRNSQLLSLDGYSTTGVQTTTIQIPTIEEWSGFNGSGKYYLGMAVDTYGDVDETDGSNNSLVGAAIDYEKITIEI